MYVYKLRPCVVFVTEWVCIICEMFLLAAFHFSMSLLFTRAVAGTVGKV